MNLNITLFVYKITAEGTCNFLWPVNELHHKQTSHLLQHFAIVIASIYATKHKLTAVLSVTEVVDLISLSVH